MKKTAYLPLFASLAVLLADPSHAQVVIAPSTPQIGSSNPATAEPLVPRPTTTPCVVPLVQDMAFDTFNTSSFSYAPPPGCPGPWAKVVFTADFTVATGSQYDRTAAVYLGHANLFYGTTAEPAGNLNPSWHVERDVTDLAAIFKNPQTGEFNLANSSSGSVIYGSAALEFYPANASNPAPRTPDIVVPINGTGGDAGTLNTTASAITQTVNLPQNVSEVYLDVQAQPQSNDEFYYFCVPDNDTGYGLVGCGNTAFRETEVSIDGQPAGVAPVYPYLNTGGLWPLLWIPIASNQAFNHLPYRVNLTPFAGLLSDGKPHTVSINVYNADSYFLATANLLVYQDPGSSTVTGGILENTLGAAPSPIVTDNTSYNASTGTYTGPVTVTSSRDFVIKGFINTAHGQVVTTIHQKVNFTNTNTFNENLNTYAPLDESATQTTTVDSWTTRVGDGPAQTSEQHYTYPITVDFGYSFTPDFSNYTITANVDQGYKLNTAGNTPSYPLNATATSEETKSQSSYNTANGAMTNSSSQNYQYRDASGACYDETLTSANLVLTGVTNNCQAGQ